ncbi:MAG: toxic anion resistance protein [Pseudomonadota bacterium]
MQTREQAEATLKEAEAVTSALLPEVKGDLIVVDQADAAQRAEIEKRAAEIDMTSTQSIIRFGSGSQAELTAISEQMLEGVRNKDVGPAGDSLRQMVMTLRGFEVGQTDDEGGLFDWLMSWFRPAADLQERYTTVRRQIDRITDELLNHETVLLKDIKSLDKLYEKSLEFYDELAIFIAAGELKLTELDTETIPEKEKEAEAADGDQGVLKAQELRDLRQARDDLERRIHDLKLTRQVTMQSLPSIRLVQENDKALVGKINSTIVNTVPLWQVQLSQAIAIQHSKEAGEDIKSANDLTNELLKANADNLREANKEIREQLERGVVDMEALKHAHGQLISTIEESLAIADEGKRRRAEAEVELQKMETELKAKLLAASASGSGTGANVGGALGGDA